MAAKKKPAISGLHSQGIIDDIFKSAGKAVIKEIRRDVRKLNKGMQRVDDTLELKPHMMGKKGKTNMSNPRFAEHDKLESKVANAFNDKMRGTSRGAKAFNKAIFEEFGAVEKRATKRAEVRKSKAKKKK
jgi:hypothetical protein